MNVESTTSAPRSQASVPILLATMALILIFVSCTPPRQVIYKRPAQVGSTADLRSTLEALISAYEREDAMDFASHLSDDFRSSDNGGQAYSAAFFGNAIHDDFSNLMTPSFEVIVNSAVYHQGPGLCRLSLTWFRRARIPFGAEEWIVRSQNSALIFRREDGQWKLWGIEGAPIFGLSDPFGAIPVRTGEINGAAPAAGARIQNGRLQ